MSAPVVEMGERATSPLGRDFAWHVHDAQEAWTARADVKASVALALEGGLVVVLATASDFTAPLRGNDVLSRASGLTGMALALVAVVFAALAVLPITRRVGVLRHESGSNYIYFGHIRHVPSSELLRRLETLSPSQELAMLSQQIAMTGRLNWWKHRLLQMSVGCAILAVLALVLSALAYALRQYPL